MSSQVLITRPEVDADETAEILKQRGYDSFKESFLDVIYDDIEFPDLEKFDAVIFTSCQGVRAFCKNTNKRDISVYTVGDRTAEEASKNNFQNIQSAAGDLKDLIGLLEQVGQNKSLFYCRGREVSTSIVELLPYMNIEEVISYHTEKKQQISDDCVQLLLKASFSHVLFYSKRTAESFVDAIQAHPQKTALLDGLKAAKALCLGSSMVEYLSVLPWNSVEVADQPHQESLMALLKSASE